MNILEDLKTKWVLRDTYESALQQRIWDKRAGDFKMHPLPFLDEDPFLKRMSEEYALDKNCSVIDVGCGAGGYSITLAKTVGRAVGVDVSPNMINAALERAGSEGLSNCSFSAMDWAAADIDALGFRGRFDIAFAHMTPAVCDYATLEKLDDCATGLCMIEKPSRRTNLLQDACYKQIGMSGEESLDTDLINIFTYAWAKGYEPKFYYRKEVWRIPQSIEKFTSWCVDRAKLRKQLTEEEENAISEFIKEKADENGNVEEITNTTRVTVLWKKK